jgi:hypothetical protein
MSKRKRLLIVVLLSRLRRRKRAKLYNLHRNETHVFLN